jgi:hypothetical protein
VAEEDRVGHSVDYFVELPPLCAREWLTGVSGAWFEPDSPDEMPSEGEFSWGGEALHVRLGPTACYVCVPGIKYSWLLDPSPSGEWVIRFEQWLCEALPGVRAVRLDELLRLAWERERGRGWDEVPDPVGTLWAWLPTQEDEYGYEHFRLLLGVKAEWLTENVVGLARAIRSDGSRDRGAVAVLADALEEAGCDAKTLLVYCRNVPVTVEQPGRWVAEAILRALPK